MSVVPDFSNNTEADRLAEQLQEAAAQLMDSVFMHIELNSPRQNTREIISLIVRAAVLRMVPILKDEK